METTLVKCGGGIKMQSLNSIKKLYLACDVHSLYKNKRCLYPAPCQAVPMLLFFFLIMPDLIAPSLN